MSAGRVNHSFRLDRSGCWSRRGLLSCLLASTCGAILQAQNAVFSARVESVRVDVLVTDKGQPVRGLTAADFEILDEGVPQQVDLVSFDEIPLNVILALDMSNSVAGQRLDHLRAAGRAVLGQLKPSDQGALISFSQAVQLGAGLNTDSAKLQRALEQAEPTGETSLVDGVYSAMMLGESDAGRALIIVFSDGLDTTSWL